MPATFKTQYAAAVALALTANGLANNGARESTVVDNTTNLYLDAHLSLTLKTAAGALGSSPGVEVWLYSLGDLGGYTDSASGADAAFTMPTTPNLRFLGFVNVHAANTAVVSPVYSVAQAFGGALPSKWGVVIVNKTGLALNATGNSASYLGLHTKSV